MSRLDDLIADLCPDGVEFSALKDLTTYAHTRIPASSVSPDNYVGVENLLQNKQGKTTANCVPKEVAVIQYCSGDILIGNIRPYLRKIWLADRDGGTNGDVLTVQINNREQIEPKYLYYVLSSEDFFLYDIQNSKGAKMPRGSKKAVMQYRLPVPPLPVQQEIVRILDSFTELTAELQAELQARKKQYEYYRDQLLNMVNDVVRLPLSKVAKVFRGEYITQKGTAPGNIPVILGGQEPAYYIDKANHFGEIVVVARSGASAGFVSYWNEPIFITDGFGYEVYDDVALPKYLYYVLKRIEAELNAMKRGAGVPHVSGEMLGRVMLPMPNIEIQKRLIKILDSYDAICTDLSIGLPAEIAARQKQYEYYRDKLLSFKEYGGSAS